MIKAVIVIKNSGRRADLRKIFPEHVNEQRVYYKAVKQAVMLCSKGILSK